MMTRAGVDKESQFRDAIDDVTDTTESYDDVFPSLAERISQNKNKVKIVTVSMQRMKIGQNGDVNRSRVPDLEDTASDGVSQFTSIIEKNDKVQLVKPLAVKSLPKVKRKCNVLNNNVSEKSESVKVTEIIENALSDDGEFRSDHVARDPDSKSSTSEGEFLQILGTVSQRWATSATKAELWEFAKHEVLYAQPYVYRRFIVNGVLIRRDAADHIWRGQPLERFAAVEVLRNRYYDDETYLREALQCSCIGKRPAEEYRRGDESLWHILKHGSPSEMIRRLNIHERHMERIGKTGSELKIALRTNPAVKCDATPVDDDISSEMATERDAELEKLVEGNTVKCEQSIKDWLQQMRKADTAFSKRCVESARILKKLENWRAENEIRRTLREVSTDSGHDDSLESNSVTSVKDAHDPAIILEPPRWHGLLVWREFWHAFRRWCRICNLTEGLQADYLRVAIAGPVENKLVEILGPGLWTYGHTVGALQNRCRRLWLSGKYATTGAFAKSRITAETAPARGCTQWKQYTTKLFEWCEDQGLGTHERDYILWRQFTKPLGNRIAPIRSYETDAYVAAFTTVRRAEVDAMKGLLYYKERPHHMRSASPIYGGTCHTWSAFFREFTEWCDERQCGEDARAQYLRRALVGRAKIDLVTVGIDALRYQPLVAKLRRYDVGIATWSHGAQGAGRRPSLVTERALDMPTFHGQNWKKFILQFEHRCRRCQLCDDGKAHYLRRALVKRAAGTVGTINGVDWYSYKRLRHELELRFGDNCKIVMSTPRTTRVQPETPMPVLLHSDDATSDLEDDARVTEAVSHATTAEAVVNRCPINNGAPPKVDVVADIHTQQLIDASINGIRTRIHACMYRTDCLNDRVTDLQRSVRNRAYPHHSNYMCRPPMSQSRGRYAQGVPYGMRRTGVSIYNN